MYDHFISFVSVTFLAPVLPGCLTRRIVINIPLWYPAGWKLHRCRQSSAMADLLHVESSSDEEMPVQVPLVGSQRYTWFPPDDSWLVTSPDANALEEVTAHEQAAFAVYLSQSVPLTTPFGTLMRHLSQPVSEMFVGLVIKPSPNTLLHPAQKLTYHCLQFATSCSSTVLSLKEMTRFTSSSTAGHRTMFLIGLHFVLGGAADETLSARTKKLLTFAT